MEARRGGTSSRRAIAVPSRRPFGLVPATSTGRWAVAKIVAERRRNAPAETRRRARVGLPFSWCHGRWARGRSSAALGVPSRRSSVGRSGGERVRNGMCRRGDGLGVWRAMFAMVMSRPNQRKESNRECFDAGSVYWPHKARFFLWWNLNPWEETQNKPSLICISRS